MKELDGGLLLRTATSDDVEQIVRLSLEAQGQDEERALRIILGDDQIGPGGFTVVVDGDKVVSTLCLIPQSLRVCGVALPAGQVEYVATHPDYRRRGLVRAQMDEVHARSAEAGHVLQLITGILYFYRLFGYAYALGLPERAMLRRGAEVAMPDGWSVREAEPDDLDAVIALRERRSSAADVELEMSSAMWVVLIDGVYEHERVVVAERDGVVRGSARRSERNGFTYLFQVVADSLDAARALVAYGAERNGPWKLAVARRPGTPLETLLADAGTGFEGGWYAGYVRVPDPVAFLRPLLPVLSARLAASDFADETGELRVSTYTGGFRLAYADGNVTAVEPAEALEDPEDNVGVPPDLLPTFLLGRYGAKELDRRHDDVTLGPQPTLVDTIFPRLNQDAWPWF